MKKIILLILFITSLNAYADEAQTQTNVAQTQQQPPVYQIDIIAFKDIKGLQNIATTQWLPYQTPSFENALSLKQQSLIPSIEQSQLELYTPLPKQQFLLRADAAHIRRSSLYNLVTQQSWLQQALVPSQTQTVLITSGQNYSDDESNPVWELMGTVRITRSLYQYLNLKVNFYLTEPGTAVNKNTDTPEVSSEYPGLQMLQLKETRRIKVNQLNYIDSPGFGLLIKVVKVTS